MVERKKSPSEICKLRQIHTNTTCHTRSSAIAKGPRDASHQLKSCEMPRNSAEATSVRQVLNQVSAVAK